MKKNRESDFLTALMVYLAIVTAGLLGLIGIVYLCETLGGA